MTRYVPHFIRELLLPEYFERVEFDFLAEKIDWNSSTSPVVTVESMRFYKKRNDTICCQDVNEKSTIYPKGGLYLERDLRNRFDRLTPQNTEMVKTATGLFTIIYSKGEDYVLLPKGCVSSLINKEGDYEGKINTAISYIYQIEAYVFSLWDIADMQNDTSKKLGFYDVADKNADYLDKLADVAAAVYEHLNALRSERAQP